MTLAGLDDKVRHFRQETGNPRHVHIQPSHDKTVFISACMTVEVMKILFKSYVTFIQKITAIGRSQTFRVTLLPAVVLILGSVSFTCSLVFFSATNCEVSLEKLV